MHPAEAGLHAGYDGQVTFRVNPLIITDAWVHSVKKQQKSAVLRHFRQILYALGLPG